VTDFLSFFLSFSVFLPLSDLFYLSLLSLLASYQAGSYGALCWRGADGSGVCAAARWCCRRE